MPTKKRYSKIPKNTFDALQMDAGVLLRNFNLEEAGNGGLGFDPDTDIICATTGGITVACTPTFSDFGEDVDNVPLNKLELKHLDSWDCKITTTSISTDVESMRLALGCADVTANGKGVIPRSTLNVSDASDIWWVGDKFNGGLVAVKLLKAIGTTGLSLQTGKNAKGQTSLELTGHANDQDTVPMEFYSLDPVAVTSYSVTQTLTNVTSDYASKTVTAEAALEVNLEADTGYAINSVTVVMGGHNVTSLYYDDGTVSIPSVTGDVTITATAAEV